MDSGHTNSHATNNNNVTSNTNDTGNMEDTVEFRLLMSYAQRRRPGDARSSRQGSPGAPKEDADANGTSSPRTPSTKKTVNKKKKRKNQLLKLFSCVRRQGEGGEEEGGEENERQPRSNIIFRSLDDGGKTEGEQLDEVASRLTKIADGVPFIPPDIEPDGEEDEVERLIGLLLREDGDRLNEKLLKHKPLVTELFCNYSFFERLISGFLGKMGFTTFDPEALGSEGSPKTQIALTCEVTSRLSAVSTHPMSRLLGFGARYLQEHYSTWATQQGGYEEAFENEDDEEVH
ncbi:uncharacterized protein ACJ7VT_010096 [Polymixia lowei]